MQASLLGIWINGWCGKVQPTMGSTEPGQGALDYTRKHTEQAMEQATK